MSDGWMTENRKAAIAFFFMGLCAGLTIAGFMALK